MMIVKGLCGLKAEEIAFPKPPNSVQNLDKGCEVNIVYFFKVNIKQFTRSKKKCAPFQKTQPMK